MKKVLFTLAGAFLITANLSAQTAITLNESSYNADNIGIDSVVQTTANSSFPINLTATSNGTWDMSTVTDSSAIITISRVATTSGAQFADSIYNVFGPGIVYNANIQSSLTNTGVVEYGEVISRQPVPIGSMTQVATDSVIIDSQDIVYTSPRTKIAFPATYQTSWTSTYQYDFGFHLSFTPVFGYNHAPGQIHVFVTENDSVIGYGQMRVKDINGNPSGYMDVLQVQSTVTTVDSFYLNDSLANSTLLSLFGLTQGGSIYSYNQYYYRPAELTALANITFGNAAYTQPSSAQTQVQRLAADEGVANVNTGNAAVNVYPNPVPNHSISVDLPDGQSATWTYDLISITGETVATAALNSTHNQVGLSATLAPGIYYLRVNKNNSAFCIKPLEIN